jgi:hypothetical protein
MSRENLEAFKRAVEADPIALPVGPDAAVRRRTALAAPMDDQRE